MLFVNNYNTNNKRIIAKTCNQKCQHVAKFHMPTRNSSPLIYAMF